MEMHAKVLMIKKFMIISNLLLNDLVMEGGGEIEESRR
jgi:hypothetical protein